MAGQLAGFQRALRIGALAMLALGIHPSPAAAHFLFVVIGPGAEDGRWAEVYFSEYATAGDPRFIEKVSATQLWLQQFPGNFQPLTTHTSADRLRASLPLHGSMAVVGKWDYGVLARPLAKPFLLRHYPKAMEGDPTVLNRMQRWNEAPLEIMPMFASDQVTLTVLLEGKPLANTKVTVIDTDLADDELTTDGQGQVIWKPSSPGRYAFYLQHVRPESGGSGGQAYAEIREFATLSFNWPLERRDADPEAVTLFTDAIAARAQWHDFPGFKAALEGSVDGRQFSGKVTVGADGSGTLQIDDDALEDWVGDALESLVMHRIADSSTDDEQPVLRFADQDTTNPLGRLLTYEGGQFASSYRVRDREITVVNRRIGEQNMTITVLENQQNAEGKLLPRCYTVQYWNAATGALERTESVQNRWQRVGAFDLPTEHTVTMAHAAGLSVRTVRLTDLELQNAP